MTWELLPAAMWASQEPPQQPMELHLGMYFLNQGSQSKIKANKEVCHLAPKQDEPKQDPYWASLWGKVLREMGVLLLHNLSPKWLEGKFELKL